MTIRELLVVGTSINATIYSGTRWFGCATPLKKYTTVSTTQRIDVKGFDENGNVVLPQTTFSSSINISSCYYLIFTSMPSSNADLTLTLS